MHLDTGGKKIVLRKVFSLKKINNKTAYNFSIIFSQLIDFRIDGKSKSFLHNALNYGFQKSIRDLVNVKHTI